MKPEGLVVNKLADEVCKRITNNTIKQLQKLKAELSGEDSGLKNVWDEICVQVQIEYSVSWDEYENMIESIISKYISKLKEFEKIALWYQSNEGWSWLYDNAEVEDISPPVIDQDIVNYILENINSEAADWKNSRIEKYIENSYK